jgi:hypothetical protein
MKDCKGDQERIRDERREAKSKYYFLSFVFISLIILGSVMFTLLVINDILSGTFPSTGFMPFCTIVFLFIFIFLVIFPDLIKYKKIYSGEEGIRGVEWSTESDASISWGFIYLGFAVFFTFTLIVYLIYVKDFRIEFIVVIIVLIVFWYGAYITFSNIKKLGKYKFKIFSYPHQIDPKVLLKEIMDKEGLSYDHYFPTKKTIPFEFDLIIKTERDFYIRFKKLEHEKRYWISIGPRKKDNEKIIKKLMMDFDKKFSMMNNFVK